MFEYIRYSNNELNEYDIFEYSESGHSLGTPASRTGEDP